MGEGGQETFQHKCHDNEMLTQKEVHPRSPNSERMTISQNLWLESNPSIGFPRTICTVRSLSS